MLFVYIYFLYQFRWQAFAIIINWANTMKENFGLLFSSNVQTMQSI